MEHWSKTSTIEPFSLGRKQSKKKKEDLGNTSKDQNAHFSDNNFQKATGQKVFPVVRVPHGVFRRPIDDDAEEIKIGDINSSKFIRNLISSLQNEVNQELINEERNRGATSSADRNLPGAGNTRNTTSTGTSSQGNRSQQRNVGKDRQKVMEIISEFRACCDRIIKMDEDNCKRKRVDYLAAKMIKKKFNYFPDKHFMGPVPYVEIGDEFHYRMELNILGLHRPCQGGIEYVQVEGGTNLATSIVDSGLYENYKADQNTLIYCGQGGNIVANSGTEMPEDQKLEGGNLALKNSIEAKNHVRVIRGCKALRPSPTYFYDGLYTVEKMWLDKGQFMNRVFKFKLVKLPGQASQHPS